jgi:malate dehydrogenase (oxaloacetate-decarboxylating)(NADP+)
VAVAEAAMRTGVARKPIKDFDAYRRSLRARLDPTADSLELIFETVKRNPKRVVFAEGEEERTIRAALQFKAAGYGTPVLVAREEVVKEKLKSMNIPGAMELEIHNARLSHHNEKYRDLLYKRLHRKGYMPRDCQRMVNQNRNVFAATMVAADDADAMVTGLTRSFIVNYDDIRRVIDAPHPSGAFGLSIALTQNRTVFLADTAVHIEPSAERLAEIAIEAASWAHRMGHEPRVAFLSFASFGQPQRDHGERIREAVSILDMKGVKFEYDGEMAADVALDYDLMKRLYPFCRLTGPANVLVMPNLAAANIAAKLVQNIGGATVLGPVMNGLDRPAQIMRMGATVSDIVTMAVLAAYQAVKI